ncbi:MAG: bifunctional 3-deoxy-7-phosphoheptulonate synthase/chorismate mutase type II [Bacteroidales bacterium]|nr:bifunctional 3-deoxy-7-phosphoheptulonate synthase/chorismate mutase type II [Bacteroidales bacterium]
MGSKEERPFLISGPCSAENEKQVIETAVELARYGVQVYRAGIWKPRTRPDSFEGMGTVALPWLRRVKEETGMLTATEVANILHVKMALDAGIDVLWIGARTTANPFAVQEIADAVRGLDIPVFIKNPINPDIGLWIGAIERINKAGIKKIVAVHRGFSTFQETKFRNTPHWEIPIELKRRIPELPIINDPSHICGRRDLLQDVSQKAMDLDFDGLFVESHIDPDKALSDSNQQITPEALGKLINSLVIRKPEINGNEVNEVLNSLRVKIDRYDKSLLDIMQNRMKISEQIGIFKKSKNVTILQTKRWSEIVDDRVTTGMVKGLSRNFIMKIYTAIHEESINWQNAVMRSNRKSK